MAMMGDFAAVVHTFPFRKVSGVELFADVYFDPACYTTDATGHNPQRPALLFFHGGGLVEYTRKHISPYIIQACLSRGWAVISVDYRLLPQVTGLDLLDDIRAAWVWVHEGLPAAMPGLEIDIHRIAVAGQSAGGYLAYLLAATERHRWSGPPGPRCVLSIYGIPSFSHPFFNASSQIPKYPAPVEGLAPFLSPTAPVSTGSQDTVQAMIPSYSEDGRVIEAADLSGIDLPRTSPPGRGDLYDHFVRENIFPAIFGGNPTLDPLVQMDQAFPPTVIIHGASDRVVPLDCSRRVKSRLEEKGVTCHLIEVPGKDHAFEQYAVMPTGEGQGPSQMGFEGVWDKHLRSMWVLVDELMDDML